MPTSNKRSENPSATAERQSKPRPSASTGTGLETTADLAKVRDILFGDHVRGFERELDRVREEALQRLEALREELRASERALSGRIDALQSRADAGVASATRELREELERKCGTLEQAITDRLDRVRADKLDRKRLSELLGGLASQLEDGRGSAAPPDPRSRDE